MDKSIIVKYLCGEASEEEIKLLFKWVEAAPLNKKEFFAYKKAWALSTSDSNNEDRAWKKLKSRYPLWQNKRRKLISYMKYAAIFLLIFILGGLSEYINRKEKTPVPLYPSGIRIEVPAGQMSNVVLPDGTGVQLNSGTKLFCSRNFNKGERTVRLEGEAFFDVAKDREHPFLIETPSLNFKVYGTSFNIQAYPDDPEVNTTLVEGSLGIMRKNGKELARLVPGENVKYENGTHKLVISEVKLDLYTSWKEGLINFRNESLKNIARQIERWYNVKIIIKNQKLNDELYFGTIMKNKPVDQILEVLQLTSSLHYRIIHRPDKPALIYWE